MKEINFSKAVEGYLLAVSAGHLSKHTINDYQTTFRKLFAFMGNDPPITEITPDLIRSFLAKQTVSKKNNLKLSYWIVCALDLGTKRRVGAGTYYSKGTQT